ncbi:hypothetical protein [Flavobacterium sp. I3-2]|uniref:hypothetical protein n=1 Tax=Flavobacterium sp. I3-2 TaxID=2748319 RepID=UPI0015B1ED5E|nr:hypothetical protein [Flavobacterium sp. I3-2]
MNKVLILLFASVLLFSCQKKNSEDLKTVNNDTVEKKSKFQMYEMSELALLMEQMYAYNQQLRSRIIDKDSLGQFPEKFENIHTAMMTDPSDNDTFYQEQATKYIIAQKAIYDNPDVAQEKFNEMVESCLACHAKKCGGPVPRIKKLFIK